MIKLALFARLEAKPGKEQAVADFLAAGLEMVNQEAVRPSGLHCSFRPPRSAFSTPSPRRSTGRRT